MQAYETGLQAGDTRLLLSPDSEFFKYFNDASGKTPPPAKAGEHPTSPTESKPAPEAAMPPPAEPEPRAAASGEPSAPTPPPQ
jgi:membrane protease subunit HflC